MARVVPVEPEQFVDVLDADGQVFTVEISAEALEKIAAGP